MRAMAPNGSRIRRKGTNTTSKNSWLFSYKPNLQKRYLGWLKCFDHRWDALKHIETMAKALLTCYWTFLGTTSDFRADSRRPCTAGNSCTAKRGKLFESQFSGELKQENVEIGDEFLRNVYILHIILLRWRCGHCSNRQRTRCCQFHMQQGNLHFLMAGFASSATGLQMYRYHQKILAALKSALKSAFPLWKSRESDPCFFELLNPWIEVHGWINTFNG